jgi:hypothetical protein
VTSSYKVVASEAGQPLCNRGFIEALSKGSAKTAEQPKISRMNKVIAQ